MKKAYLLGVVSLLALSLLVVGCGADKSATADKNQKTGQSQDMNNMDHSQMDHSQMNMEGQQSNNKQ